MVRFTHNRPLAWETMHLRTGERVLPQKPGKKGESVKLWDAPIDRVTNQHPDYPNLNDRLHDWERDVVAAFNMLWDATPFQKVTKHVLHSHLFPKVERGPGDGVGNSLLAGNRTGTNGLSR